MAVIYIWRVVEVAYFGDAQAHENLAKHPCGCYCCSGLSARKCRVWGQPFIADDAFQ